jgi:GT2 family glycosyltransferase
MLHIIVPVHNRAAVTERLAAALARQTVTQFRLLLVDDGCTDDTVARVLTRLEAPRVRVLRGDGNLWWAGALQLAHDLLCAEPLADNDAVLILNDDVECDDDFLRQGMAVLAESPDSCIQAIGFDMATGTADRGAVANLARLEFRAAHMGEAPNCLSTRGLLMSGRSFKNSGGLRPRWLPHYLSDYEFTLRLRRQGRPLIVDERFQARVRFELTGLDVPDLSSPRALWQQAFSNRAKFNPKHWSAFVLMACPAHTIALHLLRIWVRFACLLARAARSPAGAAP